MGATRLMADDVWQWERAAAARVLHAVRADRGQDGVASILLVCYRLAMDMGPAGRSEAVEAAVRLGVVRWTKDRSGLELA